MFATGFHARMIGRLLIAIGGGLMLTSTAAADRPNVLLICVDDLRPELRSFGVSYIESPNIDALAAAGRPFARHYVQAPTCGASRFALLTGQYGPIGNHALFARAGRLRENPESVSPSMPEWFRRHGYTTVSVGKVSHHPGGMGGANWNDADDLEMPKAWDRCLLPVGPWQHPRGWMHGLAHGEIRVAASKMDLFQSLPGDDSIYPDGRSIDEACQQMSKLAADDQPFFLAVGVLRPHLPFGSPAKYMRPYADIELPPIPHPERPSGRTTWHRSGEFMKYNRWGRDPNEDKEFATEVRRHYAACVSYADAQVGRLLSRLREVGADDDTVVVLWGDHGWHLGEHAVWGKHTLFEESLRSPLIIRAPQVDQPGAMTDAIVETVDIFPTLCELTDLPVPDFAHGGSLLPMLKDPSVQGHPAIGYHGRFQTVRTPSYRLIRHDDGFIELYDHGDADGRETVNIAEQNPQVARELSDTLDSRLDR